MTDERHDLPEPDEATSERILAEMEARVKAIGVPMPDNLDELDAKLSQIEDRAKVARARHQDPDGSSQSRIHNSTREDYRGLAVGISVAYTIIGLPLGFFAIGALIDYFTDSNLFKAAFVLIGSIVGLGFGIFILNRHQNRS